MKTKTERFFLYIIVFLLFVFVHTSHIFALDFPHNDSKAIGCDSCHDVNSGRPFLMPLYVPNGTGDDNTLLNNLCIGCHNPSGLASAKPVATTHSSFTSDDDYGNWTVECWVCHSPHRQDQGADRNFIRKSINLEWITDPQFPENKTGRKTVVYDLDSFTDTDGVNDVTGICQVCHTETTHWRNDGSLVSQGVHEGMSGSGCMDCHDHVGGFKAECDSCHGFPPGALVSVPGATGSTTAGPHLKHTADLGFGCEACHFENLKNSVHNDGSPLSITIGFSPDGIAPGGSYDGHAGVPGVSGVQYDVSPTAPLTTVSSNGNKTCSNLYCHGNFAGSGKNASPVWDESATAPCGSCHGASSGGHGDHINIMGFACSLCHYNTADGNGLAAGTTHHVNYATDWRFDPNDNRTSGADYNTTNSGSKSPPSPTYSSCNNLYCHSTAQGTVDPTTAPTYRNPSWTDNLNRCKNCHNLGAHQDPPFMDTGSHYAHVQYRFTQPGNCQACHYLDKGGNLCDPCHTPHGALNSRVEKHVDGNIDIDFLPSLVGASAVYNGDNIPRTAYANCDNTYCHSNGTSVSTGAIPANSTVNWGAAGPLACDSCHEYGPSYANNFPKANSHQRHVVEIGYTCNVCHYQTTTTGNTITDFSNHVNGAFNVSPDSSFVAFGKPVNFVYTYAAGGGTCSSISCHEGIYNNPTSWGETDLGTASFGYTEGDLCGEVNVTLGATGGVPPYTYYIDWGDGQTYEGPANSHTHIYASATPATPDFEVVWTAYDTAMNTFPTSPRTNTATTFTDNILPVLNFTLSTNGLEVTLTDQSFDADYNLCGHSGPGRVMIDWDDGAGWQDYGYTLNLTDTPSMQEFTRTYSSSGTYLIDYRIWDNVLPAVLVYKYNTSVTVP